MELFKERPFEEGTAPVVFFEHRIPAKQNHGSVRTLTGPAHSVP